MEENIISVSSEVGLVVQLSMVFYIYHCMILCDVRTSLLEIT